MQKDHVYIIGLGLIGGSLARAIKREYPQIIIKGYDVSQQQRDLAMSLGVIDEAVSRIEDGAADSNWIIIAVPVLESENVVDTLLVCDLQKGTVVTDVGSAKGGIMNKTLPFKDKGVTFIGGHPLAGSHKSGIAASNARLFENAFYVLIAGTHKGMPEYQQLKDLLMGTKATFIDMSAEEHDRVVGVISHFPHLIASGLVHQLKKMNAESLDFRNLAAGGFRDITRIASSSPAMWHDVLIRNRQVLLELLKEWQEEMGRIQSMVAEADSQKIYSYFEDAKHYRDTLPQREKGALPPLFDLYVDVPDHPGIIAEVTELIAEVEISITNIRIIEMREDIIGVLRLSFRNGEDRTKARQTLAKNDYKTYLAE